MSSNFTTVAMPSVLADPTTLPLREALSGIFGSISLACWIFLLVPQLIENYRNQSAEAVSLGFILIWFLGDIFNIVGSVWAGLVPVVITLGGYFCIADGILISQVLYYGIRNRRREGRTLLEAAKRTMSSAGLEEGEGGAVLNAAGEPNEEEPLLKRTRTLSVTIPGSQVITRKRRSTDLSSSSATAAAGRRHSSNAADDHLAKILEESDSESGARLWVRNLISILAVCAVGAVGWILAYQSGAWRPMPTNGGSDGGDETIAKGAQVLGYGSALMYLVARIPQMYKNWKEQSCEGLSLLFFILSIMGNLTYGAGILCHSTESRYVLKNVPWLLGSLGTMFEDVIIFVQFHLYRTDSIDTSDTQNEDAIE